MTVQQIITDIGAVLGAVGVISAVLAHIPFMPAGAAAFFARLATYAASAKFDVSQKTDAKPSANAGSALALLLICSLAGYQSGCALFRGPVTPKTIDQAAILICDAFFKEQRPGMSLEDIEHAFCSTAEAVEPFLLAAKKAKQDGGTLALHRLPAPGAK